MSTLIERLQALTAESPPSLLREIDAEIALANGWKRSENHASVWADPNGCLAHVPRYTESLDAVEPLLRTFHWSIDKDSNGFHVTIYGNGRDIPDIDGEHEATPAIALLIAIEKAKEEAKP